MKPETIAVHTGYTPEPTTHAVAVPIYQTTSYAFDNTQHGADLFDLKVPGNIYTRITNPTNAVLEERVTALESGVAGVAVASGMAAITYAIQAIAGAGDNIVTISLLYGGTYSLLAHTLPRYGIETRFAPPKDLSALEKLIDTKTKAIFCESVGNPAGNIIDLQALADIAHRHGVPLIVDNTVASPSLCRPFEWGADIVVHSMTKYLGGHGSTLGGIIIDSGNFPWSQYPEKYPMLTEPDPSYHGVIYTEAFGPAAYAARCRVIPLRDMGAALSPFNAFLILQGVETLSLRMQRHCENALKVATFLEQHPQVSRVNFAALPSSPDHTLAKKYMDGGIPAGILSFGIKGGREAGTKFIDALKLILRLVNIGDTRSLACHPASTTHRQLNDEQLQKAGVSHDMIRLSVGIEHIDDILADITQALNAAK